MGAAGLNELARFVRDLFWRGSSENLVRAYAIATGVLAVAAVVLTRREWTPSEVRFPWIGVSILLGALLAAPVGHLDERIARALIRRTATSGAPTRRSAVPRARVIPRPVPAGLGGAVPAVPGKPGRGGRAAGRRERVVLMVVTALCEEVIFRGFLVGSALSTSWPGSWLLLLVGSLLFLANHRHLGTHQVVVKIPLLVACLAVTLVTGTVVGAIVLHVLFNLMRHRRMVRREASFGNR
ncbi:CPBP family intramembrane glutamic endopeptidase [Virgisporangium aurantiacum]|uniref:CPBP family intramembrane glutamic endopeptidase n=1 Tax=Virgisporangium aurantiacum TaxID=175570 RepID=UPI00194F6DDA|nr:CPBP family intramembrane glutamic endopeptidase [Virgisporangium aurantiacum]